MITHFISINNGLFRVRLVGKVDAAIWDISNIVKTVDRSAKATPITADISRYRDAIRVKNGKHAYSTFLDCRFWDVYTDFNF